MYDGFPLYFCPVSVFFSPHIIATPESLERCHNSIWLRGHERTVGVAGSRAGDFRETVRVMRGCLIKECPDGAYAGEREF